MAALASSFAATIGCAEAQGEVAGRIDEAFALVPGNTVDLAVPLTRRALARRAMERKRRQAAEPVRSSPAPPPAPPSPLQLAEGAAAVPAVLLKAATQAAALMAAVEEGSAAPLDQARLPRPRPGAGPKASTPATLLASVGEPLDLVAGAEVPEPRREATAEPQQLLQPPQPRVTAAIPSSALPTPPAGRAPPPAAGPAIQPPASPPAGQFAGRDCLEPDEVTDSDGDFERNAEALSSPGLCIAEEKFKERRRPWTIQTVASARPGPLWAVMHDDEQVAFDNAVTALNTHGGVLVTFETRGKRNQDGIDPNRNFSADGVGCAKLGDDAAPRFTAAFRRLYDPAQPIFALHNNFDGPVPTGGLGHASMEAVPKSMRRHRASDPDGPLADARTLVLLAAFDADAPPVANRAAELSRAGINVLVETVRRDGDCSLSNDVVLAGHENYFNVTVDHDGGEKQRRIIDVIMSSFFPVVAQAAP